MAVFSTVLPSLLLAEAIKRIGAGRVAMIGSAGPVITIYLGVVLLGEPATAMQLLGAGSRPGEPTHGGATGRLPA
jgi:drug/metabolite transporter (DMT)-like permease